MALPSNRKYVVAFVWSCSFLLLITLIILNSKAHFEDETAELLQDSIHINSNLDSLNFVPKNSQGVQMAAEFAFYRINEDRKACSLEPFDSFKVDYAERQLDSGVDYSLQVTMNDHRIYDVRVQQLLPHSYHPTSASDSMHTALPLMSHYQMQAIHPSPCDDIESLSIAQPAHIINNDHDRSWTATVYPQFHKMTQNDFVEQKLGFIPPSRSDNRFFVANENKIKDKPQFRSVQLPENFDVRDVHGSCKAFQVQDQASCGSCFLFSAASALSQRLCQYSNKRFDVNISPQDILSCSAYDACSRGGVPLMVYEAMTEDGKVSDWCSPYQAKDASMGAVCGDTCSTSLRYFVQNATIGWITDSAEEIMEELILNGPVAVGFAVHSDFPMYRSGVYKVSKWARNRIIGGHAVLIVGYGVDDVHGPYWLCQNSWGKGWGEDGYFKIARGVNEASLEGYGAFYAKPLVPQLCPQTDCQNGGEILSDCSCKCFDSWSGDRCETCQMSCTMGSLDAHACTCNCFPGFMGKNCDDMLIIEQAYGCASKPPAFSWALHHEHQIPVGSYIQVYPRGTDPWNPETNAWATAASPPMQVCGSEDKWTPQHKYCTSQGRLSITSLNPGSYDAYLMEFMGKNEFGASKGFKRPSKISPTIRIASNCNDVFGSIIDSNDGQSEIREKSKIEKQLDRAESMVRYLEQQENTREVQHETTIHAWPSVAFYHLHFWVQSSAAPSPPTTKVQICPVASTLSSATTASFFSTEETVLQDCQVVATGNDVDKVINVDVLQLNIVGLAVAQLVVDGIVQAETHITIGRCSVVVDEMAQSQDSSKLSVGVHWLVEPPSAASDADVIAVFSADSDNDNVNDPRQHALGIIFTRSLDADGKSITQPSGHRFIPLHSSSSSSSAHSFNVVFYPHGSHTPAAVTTLSI